MLYIALCYLLFAESEIKDRQRAAPLPINGKGSDYNKARLLVSTETAMESIYLEALYA